MARILKNVVRSKKYDHIYQALAPVEKSTQPKVFQTIKDLLCFAAFLGFKLGRREPLDDSFGTDDIGENTFSRDSEARSAIYMIALAASEDMQILHPDRTQDMISTFEQYANGGLSVINSWFEKFAGDRPHEIIINGLKEIGAIRIETNKQNAKSPRGKIEI